MKLVHAVCAGAVSIVSRVRADCPATDHSGTEAVGRKLSLDAWSRQILTHNKKRGVENIPRRVANNSVSLEGSCN